MIRSNYRTRPKTDHQELSQRRFLLFFIIIIIISSSSSSSSGSLFIFFFRKRGSRLFWNCSLFFDYAPNSWFTARDLQHLYQFFDERHARFSDVIEIHGFLIFHSWNPRLKHVAQMNKTFFELALSNPAFEQRGCSFFILFVYSTSTWRGRFTHNISHTQYIQIH